MEAKKRSTRRRGDRTALADTLTALQVTGRTQRYRRFSFDGETDDRIRELLRREHLGDAIADALVAGTEEAVAAYQTYGGTRNRSATARRMNRLAKAASSLKKAYSAVRDLPEFEALQNGPDTRIDGEEGPAYLGGGKTPRWRRGVQSLDEGFLTIIEMRAAAAARAAKPATKRRDEDRWFLAFQLVDLWRKATGCLPADTRSDIEGRSGVFHEFANLVAAAPNPNGPGVVAPCLESTLSEILAAVREK